MHVWVLPSLFGEYTSLSGFLWFGLVWPDLVGVISLGYPSKGTSGLRDVLTWTPLRVPNRSPTPISKTSDFRGPFDHIWGAPGPHFRPIWGVPGVRAALKNTYFLAL